MLNADTAPGRVPSVEGVEAEPGWRADSAISLIWCVCGSFAMNLIGMRIFLRK